MTIHEAIKWAAWIIMAALLAYATGSHIWDDVQLSSPRARVKGLLATIIATAFIVAILVAGGFWS